MDCRTLHSMVIAYTFHSPQRLSILISLALSFSDRAYPQIPPSKAESNPVMKSPETKRLGTADLFVRVASGGRSLQVHFLQDRSAPQISYDEVSVRAFDEINSEIAVARAIPQETIYMGSAQSTGFYRLSPEKDQRLASVQITRGGDKQTFAITPDMVAPALRFPTLQGQETFVNIYYEGDRIGITVRILTKAGAPRIFYSEVKVRAFDEAGAEVPVSQADSKENAFSGLLNTQGKYLLDLKHDQRVVAVEVARGGDKQIYTVTHERK